MPVTEEKQRTLRDLVLEGMSTRGLEEVPCVEFVLKDDSIVQVLTDNNPVLNRPASDAQSMKFKTSAEAGSSVRPDTRSIHRLGDYLNDVHMVSLSH